MPTEAKCKDRIAEHYRSRMADLRAMVKADNEGNESGPEDTGPLNEYGLAFDYVYPGTFKGQRRGYFRYQISWGGPSDEFRFFCDEQGNAVRVEYWFMDWFDGARRTLRGEPLEFMQGLFDYFTGGDALSMIGRERGAS